MPLAPGVKLGPYEVVAPLGAGGMGEVYRARDARLGRDVAIKVLPQHLSTSPEVRARFEREAKTVSSLNHPNICVLFDVGREGDTDFLVMELVEGETLAARLSRGALPTPEVLRLGAQIADGLDRAHRAGVVHRDLKPGNIMLTRSGAKLMDFGLARATGMAGPATGSGATIAALTQSPTVAQPLTAEGTIVGTFQYMSPEQLEGKEADARSDIWGLGCVIYEMTTGRRAFEGKSQASLISSIMKDEPAPISQLSPMSPPALDRLVRTCLAKEPDDRWQSAGDLGRELNWIRVGDSQVGAPAAAPVRSRLPRDAFGWIGGAAVALAALLVAFGPWSARRDDARLVRFMLGPPPGVFIGIPAEAEFSPDGRLLAFVAIDSAGFNHIYVRPFSNPEARMVPGTERATLPFWSPDGRMLGFFSDGKLRKVALDGSAPVVLCEAPDGRGGTWSKDGLILFAPNNQGPIARVSANGGEPTIVTQVNRARQERGHRYPQFLPDGRHFLYVAVSAAEEQSTFVASLDKSTPAEVCRAGSMARYASPGYLLYLDTGVTSAHRRLLARRFDPGSRRVRGEASLVLDEVNATNFGYANVASSGDGTLIAEHWTVPLLHLGWWDRRGGLMSNIPQDIATLGGALSPDGQRLAYGGAVTSDLFVRDLSSGVSTRLTFENREVGNVAWSFDGRRIAFARLFTSGGWATYVKSADGTGPDSLLFRAQGLFTFPMSWSRDGRWLVANCSDSLGNYDLWRIPMAGQGRPEIYQRTPEQEQDAKLSPDGHWIAYIAAQGDQSALYVQSFPEPGAKYQVAAQDPTSCIWSDRGDQILYTDRERQLHAVQVSTEGGFRQGATTRLFQLPGNTFIVDIARGEQRLLVGTFKDVSASTRLEIVLGWTRLLEKP